MPVCDLRKQLLAFFTRQGEKACLFLRRRQAVKAAGLKPPLLAARKVHPAQAVNNPPILVHQNQIRAASNQLRDQRFSVSVAHFISRVELHDEHALKARLRDCPNTRTDEVLAQQHAKHRRLSGILRRLRREMHARTACPSRYQQFFVALQRAQRQKQQIPLRLLHLVDFCPRERRGKLFAQGVERYSVERHRLSLHCNGKELCNPFLAPEQV